MKKNDKSNIDHIEEYKPSCCFYSLFLVKKLHEIKS